MDSKPLELSEAARAGCADRIGMARLAKMAFDGPVRQGGVRELDRARGLSRRLGQRAYPDRQQGVSVYIDSRQGSSRHVCILAFVMGNDSAGPRRHSLRKVWGSKPAVIGALASGLLYP